nr:MAG TPA_asm: hypothetical protein [Caudoviricetes sp.]
MSSTKRLQPPAVIQSRVDTIGWTYTWLAEVVEHWGSRQIMEEAELAVDIR